jgi:hypothetical protein
MLSQTIVVEIIVAIYAIRIVLDRFSPVSRAASLVSGRVLSRSVYFFHVPNIFGRAGVEMRN